MAGSRIPGPVCGSNAPPLDDGTLMRWWAPLPGRLGLEAASSNPRQWHNFSRAGGFASSTLTMSPQATAFLRTIEKLRLQPYDDCSGGDVDEWVKGATIGYGHLIAQAEWDKYKDGITKDQADDLFRSDVAPFERVVGDTIAVGLQQYEFDALVILAFNIGIAGFRNSTVALIINGPRSELHQLALEHALMSWNKAHGKFNAGLANRRAAEWRIYTSASYVRW